MFKLYIDPGTGAMLFTMLVGLLSVGFYSLKSLRLKLAAGWGKKSDSGERIPLLIYSEGSRYWNVFRPVLAELDKRNTDVVYWTSSEDDPVFAANFSHVRPAFVGGGNKAFLKLNFANADVMVSTTPGLDVYQWKRSRDVACYVHLPHAASDISCYRMFGIDYYDVILLSGEYQARQVRELERLRKLPAKEIDFVGVPYLDDMARRLAAAEPIVKEKTTVLVAPSWGPNGIFSRYGGRILRALLDGTDYEIIVRPHPQSFQSEAELMDNLMKEFPASERLTWDRSADNFDVLRRADILISDFSGIIFDFALVYDKPVIYADTSFDKAALDAAWIEEEIWTLRVLPTIGRALAESDLDHIGDVVEGCLSDPRYKAGREAARRETWMYPGEGAARVADVLMEKQRAVRGRES